MLALIKKHPLLTCLIVALILRLFATTYSKGFMANDDHFETIEIAYDGIQNGLLNDDGLLIWNTVKPERIGRSPLYVLTLYSLMSIQRSIGIYSLDSMMYLIRFLHALLSLLLVYYGYRYVQLATGKDNYALLAGLMLAGQFLMPYLAVRNLIELVSVDLLLPAIYFAYLGIKRQDMRLMIVSGILSVLAWMIRFNTGLAVVPIPLAIWLTSKSFRSTACYCVGLLIALVFAGYLDTMYLGSFGQSTIRILEIFLDHVENPLLPQPFWVYTVLIFGIFIPPFSFYFLLSAFRKHILREHLILISSILVFFVVHSAIASKQERFMIPIFPLLMVLGVIGLYHMLKSNSFSIRYRKLFRYSWMFALALNLVLLPIFTFNYAHKGLVEPFVYLSEQDDVEAVLIDRTERFRFVALSYAGYTRPRLATLDEWSELEEISSDSSLSSAINYFVIYSESIPVTHVDSLSQAFGPIKQVFHSTPSTMDYVLHFLNPRHNRTNEAWIYKTES